MSEAAVQVSPPRAAWFPRLGSALAIAPLGVWTVWHLWQNFSAARGEEPWTRTITEGSSPMASTVVSVVVFAPLFIHLVWGMKRIAIASPNKLPFFGNLKYVLQRVSAVGVLLFLFAHVYLARIKPALNNPTGHEDFADIAAHMRHHPPTLIVYVLGILGTAYHLANGVYTASFIYGLAASPKAQRRMTIASMVLFVLLLGLGWGAIGELFTGGASYAAPVD